MKIANVMFGRGLGGIEQAFLDYNEALILAGHEVMAVTHPLAAINPDISGKLTHTTLSNRGSWDFLAALRLRKLYNDWQPDIIICHGNRAISLNLLVKPQAGVVGITHNYQLRRFHRLDAVIAITEKLAQAAMKAGVAEEKITLIPNMVRMPHCEVSATGTLPQPPMVIGAMGRMVEKKGFHLLLEAAAILHHNGIPFRLRVGGAGGMEVKLRKQAKILGIDSFTEFTGWVQDKAAFFAGMDIFCLPSLHEPFGIVLLEAMAYGKPVVGFSSEGPSEIIRNHEAILVENGNVEALAEALTYALQQPLAMQEMAISGHQLVEEQYALPAISKKIDALLQKL